TRPFLPTMRNFEAKSAKIVVVAEVARLNLYSSARNFSRLVSAATLFPLLLRSLPFDFLKQPCPAVAPIAVGRADRDPENLSRLLSGEPNEVTEFYKLCHLLVVLCEFGQSLIQRQQFVVFGW